MLSPIPIDRISTPKVEEFYKNYVYPNKPVVITGMVDDWQATKKWNLNYFTENFGAVKASAYPIANDYCDVTVNRGSPLDNILVKDVIDSISKGHLNDGMAIASLIDKFQSSLKLDYDIPIYCKNETLVTSRLFIGPKGLLSPLHQDIPENLYVLLKGKKRLMLYPPNAPVYPSRFSKLPNHSYVNPEYPNYDKYLKFINAQQYIVDLEAGETLFIPSLWWHHLRNLEPSIALNFWWSRGWKLYLAKAMSVYRKLKK